MKTIITYEDAEFRPVTITMTLQTKEDLAEFLDCFVNMKGNNYEYEELIELNKRFQNYENTSC